MNWFKSKKKIRQEKESLLAYYTGEFEFLTNIFAGVPYLPDIYINQMAVLRGNINELNEELELTGDELFPPNGAQDIKQAIVDYSTGGASALGITDGFNTVGFPPGENVLLSRLYTPINSIPGHSITDLKIGKSLPLPVIVPIASDLTILFNQVAVFSVGSIVITVT